MGNKLTDYNGQDNVFHVSHLNSDFVADISKSLELYNDEKIIMVHIFNTYKPEFYKDILIGITNYRLFKIERDVKSIFRCDMDSIEFIEHGWWSSNIQVQIKRKNRGYWDPEYDAYTWCIYHPKACLLFCNYLTENKVTLDPRKK